MTNTLKLHIGWNQASETAGAVPYKKVWAYLITAEGRRLQLCFMGWNRPVYRYTNKRTGAKLQRKVYEGEDVNSLVIEWYYKQIEYNSYTKRVNEACYGEHEQDREKAEGLHYTEADLLKLANLLTGRDYTAIEYIPFKMADVMSQEWNKKRELEEVTAINEAILNEVIKLSKSIERYLKIGINVPAYVTDKLQELEQLTNTDEIIKKATEHIIKNKGGYREKAFLQAPYHIILKKASMNGRQCADVYNLVPDAHGVLHYCTIDVSNNWIVG